MGKFSFHSKYSKESLRVVEAKSKEDAVDFFAKLKVLSVDKFLELYEVIER